MCLVLVIIELSDGLTRSTRNRVESRTIKNHAPVLLHRYNIFTVGNKVRGLVALLNKLDKVFQACVKEYR